MAGTLEEQEGKKASNIGVAEHQPIKVNMLVASGFSEPILLAGRKVVCLQSNAALTATNITIQGALFSSNTAALDDTTQKDGLVIPLDADFNDLFDKTDTIVQFAATTGQKVWALPDAGFPIWIRLSLSFLQNATFYLSAKG